MVSSTLWRFFRRLSAARQSAFTLAGTLPPHSALRWCNVQWPGVHYPYHPQNTILYYTVFGNDTLSLIITIERVIWPATVWSFHRQPGKQMLLPYMRDSGAFELFSLCLCIWKRYSYCYKSTHVSYVQLSCCRGGTVCFATFFIVSMAMHLTVCDVRVIHWKNLWIIQHS